MTDFTKPADDIPMWANTTTYMPLMADIPKDFEDGYGKPFVELQKKWFFEGLSHWPLKAKPGIDERKAKSHLNFIQRSWDTQHQHKQAAVAYLMSLWFDWLEVGREKPTAPKKPKRRLLERRPETVKTTGPWKPGQPLRGGLG